MKKVLIITYYWPPGSGPGVQRFLKFTKYLRSYGWEPVILTVKNGSYPSIDESLLNDIPDDVKVYKTKAFEPFALYNMLKGNKGKSMGVGGVGISERSLSQRTFNWIRANLFIPDARAGWNLYAKSAASRIIKQEDIDVVITTGPPHSTHLMGLSLAGNHPVKWVADMRDPWTSIYYNEFLPRNKRTRRKDLKLETQVLQSADLVTTVSHGLKQEFDDRADWIEVIYNGFDKDDFEKITKSTNEKFTLSYIGNFKPNQNVESLWQAWAELCNELPGFKENSVVSITGNTDASVRQSVDACKLSDHVKINDFVAHAEAIQLMKNADMLLFIIPNSKRNKLIITGKLFEYLATQNELLAIGPKDGDAARIIASAGYQELISYNEKDMMKERIREAYLRWKQHTMPRIDVEKLNAFSRSELTRRLAESLDRLMDK